MRARRTCARCLSGSVLSSSPPPTDCRPSHAAAQNVSLLPRPLVRSFSLSHSGLISFDGKMNVIISLPQKNLLVPLPISSRESQFSLRSPYAAPPAAPPLYFEWNCGVASHPARRHGIAVLNLFVCAGATHGVVAAKGCERPCSPRSAPARARRARRPSVESPSDVTGYSLTLWLSR